MNSLFRKPLVILASVGVLGACSTTTPATSYFELSDTSGGTATVRVVTLDPGTMTASTTTGTYDYATGTLTVGGPAITLDATSALSEDQGATAYSYVSGLNVTDENKMVVVVTDAADLPSDTTIVYNGQALVTVTDASATYEGTMESTITANFGSAGDTVTIVLDTITDATETAGATVAYVASGAEDITITDLVISGATFTTGGSTTAVVDGFGSAVSTIDTSGATLTAGGVFAGSAADEVAGAATVDASTAATNAGTALITFSGTQ
ncbi:MAG: hypothetical protein QGI08_03505 [Paracoccaceae bacterium]|jgi:hypothetical protein|nr:hypothetical protein [Paracoccaceae bacterium]MDP7184767.1 hypothetical protein [Paracoccaceae bacterium]